MASDSKSDVNYNDAILTLAGELKAMRAELSTLKKERRRDEVIAWAKDQVTGYSVGSPAKFTAEIQGIYNDLGASGVRSYVRGLTGGDDRCLAARIRYFAFEKKPSCSVCSKKHIAGPGRIRDGFHLFGMIIKLFTVWYFNPATV